MEQILEFDPIIIPLRDYVTYGTGLMTLLNTLDYIIQLKKDAEVEGINNFSGLQGDVVGFSFVKKTECIMLPHWVDATYDLDGQRELRHGERLYGEDLVTIKFKVNLLISWHRRIVSLREASAKGRRYYETKFEIEWEVPADIIVEHLKEHNFDLIATLKPPLEHSYDSRINLQMVSVQEDKGDGTIYKEVNADMLLVVKLKPRWKSIAKDMKDIYLKIEPWLEYRDKIDIE